MNNGDVSLIEKISNFVESIRLDCKQDRNHCDRSKDYRSPSDQRSEHQQSNDDQRSVIRRDRSPAPAAERVTDQLLVQAEKFRAKVEAPKGTKNFGDLLLPYDYEQLRSKFVKPEGLAPIDPEIMILRNFDQDDEFFHITSQIEPALRAKIERGEYIELERLLPKDWASMCRPGEELNKQLFQLITQGTDTYLEPPMQKTGKINSVRKWDQAFRVYAAVYTCANPERSSEIWQYIYVIHTAAAANLWENVYFYDINFRELIACKPWKSWGKTYTQGWNMAFNNNAAAAQSHGHQSSVHQGGMGYKNGGNFSGGKSWKDSCCWKFNKNKCNKTASDCSFDHRCTYCGIWNHGFHNCRKRLCTVP